MIIENIFNLIKRSKWNEIVKLYSPEDVALKISFKEGIIISYKMLYNCDFDENIQNFSVNLLYALKNKYSKEWNSSWNYDAFLGEACNITLRYDERYLAFRNAANKADPVPPSLKVLMAMCFNSPGNPPISLSEAENLLHEALEEEQTIEGVSLMKAICERKGDHEKVAYWNKILKKVELQGIRIHGIEPSFLKDMEILSKNL